MSSHHDPCLSCQMGLIQLSPEKEKQKGKEDWEMYYQTGSQAPSTVTHLWGEVPKGGRFWILSVPVQKWYAEPQNLKQICCPQNELGVEGLYWSPQPLFLGYWRNHRRQMENNCSNFGHLYYWNVLKFTRLELGFDEMGLWGLLRVRRDVKLSGKLRYERSI